MILIIDNYDSFSYNLYQLIGSVCPDIRVIRNDAMTVSEIEALDPLAIVVSPGPGRPDDAGISIDVIKELGSKIPILGVCLGHQSICQAYGAVVTYAKELMHGKQSAVSFKGNNPLFEGLAEKEDVARYHSLAADPDTMPDCLEVNAVTDDGEVMAVMHKEYPVFGVQFHPESIMTPSGKKMLENFVGFAEEYKKKN